MKKNVLYLNLISVDHDITMKYNISETKMQHEINMSDLPLK